VGRLIQLTKKVIYRFSREDFQKTEFGSRALVFKLLGDKRINISPHEFLKRRMK